MKVLKVHGISDHVLHSDEDSLNGIEAGELGEK